MVMKSSLFRVFAVLMIMFCLSSALLGLDSLEMLLPENKFYVTLFPEYERGTGEVVFHAGQYLSNFEYLFRKTEDGGYYFFSESGVSTVEKYFTSKMRLISHSNQFHIKEDSIIKKQGYDRRQIDVDAAAKTIILTLYKDGSMLSQHKFPLNENTVDTDNIVFMLQSMLLSNKHQDFYCDVLVPNERGIYPMKFRFQETESITSLPARFDFPAGMKALDKEYSKYNVFVMSLDSIFSLFVWTKWYLVYDARYPYSFIAYWTDEKDYEFYYVGKHIYKEE
ncbi:MAG: hypothetical protein JW969_02105 [Spirochaetales bacterium]|nr:hypothetical protein [Spirochaetales bacterium]